MAAAEVGDDVFRDDPTVLELGEQYSTVQYSTVKYSDETTLRVAEERMAALTGKEAALFVTSGTMGTTQFHYYSVLLSATQCYSVLLSTT